MGDYSPTPALPITTPLIAAVVERLKASAGLVALLGSADYVYADEAPVEPPVVTGSGKDRPWMRAVVRAPWIPGGVGSALGARSVWQPIEVMLEAPDFTDPAYSAYLLIEKGHQHVFTSLVGWTPVVNGQPIHKPIRWPGAFPERARWSEPDQLYYSTARFWAALSP